MNLRQVIQNDYYHNLRNVWLPDQETSPQGYNHILKLYGYQPIQNQYNYVNLSGYWHVTGCNFYTVKCWSSSPDDAISGQQGVLFPENDGLLFVFINRINTYGQYSSSDTIFTGESLFIPKDRIFGVKLEPYGLGQHDIKVSYETKNKPQNMLFKITGMLSKHWPVDKLQKEYIHAINQHQMYQNRMNIKDKNVKQFVKQQTINDWLNPKQQSVLTRIKNVFNFNVDTIESSSDFYFSDLIILICIGALAIIEIIVNLMNQLSSIDIYAIGITFIGGLYFVILNGIRLWHEIRLYKQIPDNSNRKAYIKVIINQINNEN